MAEEKKIVACAEADWLEEDENDDLSDYIDEDGEFDLAAYVHDQDSEYPMYGW